MTWKLEWSDRQFKATIIEVIRQATMNMEETSINTGSLGKETDDVKER